MKLIYGLLGASVLVLSACDTPGNLNPTGGSAGEMGPGYCDSPPTDMEQMNHWNQLCMPDK